MHINTAQKNAACTCRLHFAQVREYMAVCSYIPTSKYRGKPLALCKTLVARTCSLEAAHSFLSDAVLNFCSTVHRVHYTAGMYTPYCVTKRARAVPLPVSHFFCLPVFMNSEVSEWSIFSKNIEKFRSPLDPRWGEPRTPKSNPPPYGPGYAPASPVLH